MSYLRVTLACLLATTAATASLAQDASPGVPTATAAAPAAKPVQERKLCQQETETGSIMPHTTCHTKAEWAAINAQNQQQVDQMRMHRGAGASQN